MAVYPSRRIARAASDDVTPVGTSRRSEKRLSQAGDCPACVEPAGNSKRETDGPVRLEAARKSFIAVSL